MVDAAQVIPTDQDGGGAQLFDEVDDKFVVVQGDHEASGAFDDKEIFRRNLPEIGGDPGQVDGKPLFAGGNMGGGRPGEGLGFRGDPAPRTGGPLGDSPAL